MTPPFSRPTNCTNTRNIHRSVNQSCSINRHIYYMSPDHD